MASIQTGSGRRRRKAVDVEIPLIPFIDLLLCCVMFLLVTAVWNQLARVHVTQRTDPEEFGISSGPRRVRLQLEVTSTGYVLASTLGDRTPFTREDVTALTDALRARSREDSLSSITIAPDDDVTHGDVIRAMDIALGSGFRALDLS